MLDNFLAKNATAH